MRKFVCFLSSIVFILFTLIPAASIANMYTPLDMGKAVQVVNDAYQLYTLEVPDPNFQVLLVDAQTNNPNLEPDYWQKTYGIECLEPQIWMLSFGWPMEHGQKNGKKWNENPWWTVPQEVINKPGKTPYFIFNTDLCNTMNDTALAGLVIHDIGHLYDWSVRYSTDTIDLQTVLGYSFREKMNDSYILASKAKAVIPLYEYSLWAEEFVPPIGDIIFLSTFTPEELKEFVFRPIRLLEFYYPDTPLEQLLGAELYEAYVYLNTH